MDFFKLNISALEEDPTNLKALGKDATKNQVSMLKSQQESVAEKQNDLRELLANVRRKHNQIKEEQQKIILETIRQYNKDIPVVQNMDFGHTEPQIPMPYGNNICFDSKERRIFATF